jgi:hypothetical protein
MLLVFLLLLAVQLEQPVFQLPVLVFQRLVSVFQLLVLAPLPEPTALHSEPLLPVLPKGQLPELMCSDRSLTTHPLFN